MATKEELEEKLYRLKKRGEDASGLRFEASNRDGCVKVCVQMEKLFSIMNFLFFDYCMYFVMVLFK